MSTILRARFWTQIKFKLTPGLQSECGRLPCLDALLNTAEIHSARLLRVEAFHLSGITPIGSRLNFMISLPLRPYLFKKIIDWKTEAFKVDNLPGIVRRQNKDLNPGPFDAKLKFLTSEPDSFELLGTLD